MTNEDVECLIDSLNDNTNELIFISKLYGNVDLAKVWTSEPKGDIANESSYPFYFIKNDEGTYVAAVLDMGSDLHVFVKKEYRKKGYLSQAMNEIILPYLYQTGRKKQIITFIDPRIGDYVEKLWGFKLINEKEAEKDLSCFEGTEKIVPQPRSITSEEFKSIKRKIDKARLYLIMASEHVESVCGIGKDASLIDLAQDILWLDDEVLNFIEDKQGPLI